MFKGSEATGECSSWPKAPCAANRHSHHSTCRTVSLGKFCLAMQLKVHEHNQVVINNNYTAWLPKLVILFLVPDLLTCSLQFVTKAMEACGDMVHLKATINTIVHECTWTLLGQQSMPL